MWFKVDRIHKTKVTSTKQKDQRDYSLNTRLVFYSVNVFNERFRLPQQRGKWKIIIHPNMIVFDLLNGAERRRHGIYRESFTVLWNMNLQQKHEGKTSAGQFRLNINAENCWFSKSWARVWFAFCRIRRSSWCSGFSPVWSRCGSRTFQLPEEWNHRMNERQPLRRSTNGRHSLMPSWPDVSRSTVRGDLIKMKRLCDIFHFSLNEVLEMMGARICSVTGAFLSDSELQPLLFLDSISSLQSSGTQTLSSTL